MSWCVDLLLEMLKIYSPSGKEGRLADLLMDKLKERGLSARRDGAGNVIAEVGRGKPHVLFCGHMDTVPGKLPVKRAKGEILGRGAVDAKGPLAAMITAVSEFAPALRGGRITLVACVEEESSGRGVKHLAKSPILSTIDCAIFGEPSGVGKITVGYRGRMLFSIRCKTRWGGHSGASWLYANAIEEAYNLWRKLRGRWVNMRVSKQKFYSVSACLTRLKGGEYHNVVPSKCEMTVDVRVPTGINCENIVQEVSRVAKEVAIKRGVDVEWRVIDELKPFQADTRSVLVKALKRAIRDVTGKEGVLMRKTGASDMSVLGPLSNGAVVAYGPGDPSLEHTGEERIKVSELLSGVKVYRRVLELLLPTSPANEGG
jgi:LysW-gamma-L-lysine carboxypeptidase